MKQMAKKAIKSFLPWLYEQAQNGRDAQLTGSCDWSTHIHHDTLVYQYRMCHTMSLYCTGGALSRSVM